MIDRESIHVWRVRLDSDGGYATEQIARWRSLLSADELRKADAFHAENHRRDYVATHAALRTVLSGCLGISPGAVKYAAADVIGGGRTKPRLAVHGALTELRFNLSHTWGAALIGVSRHREIGVDIEWQRPIEDLTAMARSIFSAEELDRWVAAPLADRLSAFYRVWTRKEAYLKAIGLGLYRNLQDVTVPFAAQAPADSHEEVRVRDCAAQDAWCVGDVPVAAGYSAAISSQGDALGRLVVTDLNLRETMCEIG